MTQQNSGAGAPQTPDESRISTAKVVIGFIGTNIITPLLADWLGFPPAVGVTAGVFLALCFVVWAYRLRWFIAVPLLAVSLGSIAWAYRTYAEYKLDFILCDKMTKLDKGNGLVLLTRYSMGINLRNNTGRDIWIKPVETSFKFGMYPAEETKPETEPTRLPPGNENLMVYRTVIMPKAPDITALPEGHIRLVVKYGVEEASLPKTLIFSGDISPTLNSEGDTIIGFNPDRDSDASSDPSTKCYLHGANG